MKHKTTKKTSDFYGFLGFHDFLRPHKAEGRGQIRAPLAAPKRLPPLPDLGELKEALSAWNWKKTKVKRTEKIKEAR